jgi:predicted GTPase
MGNQSNSEKTIEEEKIQNIEQETKEKNEKEKIQKISLNMKPLKIAILGDAKVGKTNFIRKSMNEPFQLEYLPTIGKK